MARRPMFFAAALAALALMLAVLPQSYGANASDSRGGFADGANITPPADGEHGFAQVAPGRVLAKFEGGGTPLGPAVSASLRDVGASVIKTFDNAGGVSVLRVPEGQERQIAASLSDQPSVEYAEPDYIGHYLDTPNDRRFRALWGLHNTGQTGGRTDADIDAPEAWDISTGSSSTVVAVLDSGVDYTHPDLAGNMWVNPGEIPGNGVDDDGNGFVDDVHGADTHAGDGDPMDKVVGHGTHVAGTIGAVGDNRIGVTGVNQDVSIMALRIGGPQGPTLSGALGAFEYLLEMKSRGVDVRTTNNSWGAPDTEALRDGIASLNDAGVLFVAAAGNSRADADEEPFYPAKYDLPNIISVAASTDRDAPASFTNFGSQTVDLAAPGEDILSTVPNRQYGNLSGTSMASPHVAGVAALVMANDPGLTMGEVRRVLLSSVDVQPRWRPLVLTGGRLNAHRALTADGSDTVLLAHGPDRAEEFLVGDTSVLEVEAISGADAVTGGTVTATFASPALDKTLRDDGSGPDETAGDGVYTASHTWRNVGIATVTFTLTVDGTAVATKRVPATVTAATEPRSVSAAPGDGSATVTWQAPQEVGAPGLEGYRVTSIPDSPNGPVTVSGTSTEAVVTGLENGTAYSFRVTGFADAGDGNTSDASNRVVPRPAPVISVSQESLNISVDGSSATSAPLTLTNEGEGVLNFRISPRSPLEATGVSAAQEEPALVPGARRLGGDLFAVGASGKLLRVDAATGVTHGIPLPTEQAPTDGAALAATEDHLFYADGLGDNTVYRMTHGGEVVGSFPAPSSLFMHALAYSDGVLYGLAANEDLQGNVLFSMDPQTGEELGRFDLGGLPPGGLAPGPDGNLYASFGMSDASPAMAIINPENGAILDTITIPSPFFGLAHDRRLLVGGDISGQNNVVIAPASFDTRRSRLITLGELDEFGPIFGLSIATPAQWLSATPRSRVLQPGESMTVDVKVNPSSLDPGAHRARLMIEGAHADSGAITVPVSAHVGEPPQMTLSAPEIELPMARETTMSVSLANLPPETDLARFDIRVNWDNRAADVLEVAEGDASFERFDVALNRRAGAARISGSFATAPAGDVTLAELNVSAVCRAVPDGTAVELSVSHPRGGIFDAEGNRVPVSSEPGSVTCVQPRR